MRDPSPLRPYLLSPLYLDPSQGHKSGQPFLPRPAPGTGRLHYSGELDLGGHVWGGSLLKHPEALGRRNPPPRASTDPRGCSIPSGVHPRFGRRDLHPRQAAAGQGVRLSPPPRHPREDKAAVTALAGLRQGLSGGRGQERGLGSGGFRRGAGSFCGNVPDALQETKRTRSSRARASPGWKIPREVATAPEQGTSPTPFFPAQPPHPSTQDLVCAMVTRSLSGGCSRPVTTRMWTSR